MPLAILNSDWLSQNANRSYPLDDAATGTSSDGSFYLPPNFLLDLVWPVHVALNLDPRNFLVRSVASAGSVVTVSLAYLTADSEYVTAGSFAIDASRHSSGGLYFISGEGMFADSSGRAVVGNLADLAEQGGAYEFTLEGARLSPATIRPNLLGVSSVIVSSDSDVSDRLTGDIRLIEGDGVRFTVDGNTIRVDANPTDPCECDESRAIRTINNIPPDANGNFELVGDECLEFEPMLSGLRIVDKCSQSCCGCDELSVLTQEFNTYAMSLRQLDSLVTKLEGKVDTAMVNALASIVNDPNCGG